MKVAGDHVMRSRFYIFVAYCIKWVSRGKGSGSCSISRYVLYSRSDTSERKCGVIAESISFFVFLKKTILGDKLGQSFPARTSCV